MDFHSLPRRDLQALCKINRIPANMTNVAMADALQALQTVEGLDGIQEAQGFLSPKKVEQRATDQPRTGRRTSTRSRRPAQDEAQEPASSAAQTRRTLKKAPEIKKLVIEGEDEEKEIPETQTTQGSPLPRSRRVVARTSEVGPMVLEEDEKGEEEGTEKIAETPVLRTGRRTRAAARGTCKKEENDAKEGTEEIAEVSATVNCRRTSVRRKETKSTKISEEEGEDKGVVSRTSRYRTRLSSKKEIEVAEVSVKPRTRSARASAAIKMAALVQEEQEQKDDSGSAFGSDEISSLTEQEVNDLGDKREGSSVISDQILEEEISSLDPDSKIEGERESLQQNLEENLEEAPEEQNGERDDRIVQANEEESPIRGLVLISKDSEHQKEEHYPKDDPSATKKEAQIELGTVNEDSIEKDEGNLEVQLPTPLSNESTGDHLPEGQVSLLEMPTSMNPTSESRRLHVGEKEEAYLNLQLAGMTLDRISDSSEDLQDKQSPETIEEKPLESVESPTKIVLNVIQLNSEEIPETSSSSRDPIQKHFQSIESPVEILANKADLSSGEIEISALQEVRSPNPIKKDLESVKSPAEIEAIAEIRSLDPIEKALESSDSQIENAAEEAVPDADPSEANLSSGELPATSSKKISNATGSPTETKVPTMDCITFAAPPIDEVTPSPDPKLSSDAAGFPKVTRDLSYGEIPEMESIAFAAPPISEIAPSPVPELSSTPSKKLPVAAGSPKVTSVLSSGPKMESTAFAALSAGESREEREGEAEEKSGIEAAQESIYLTEAAENDKENESADGLTPLTGKKVTVKLVDLKATSLRKLRAMVKEKAIQVNNNKGTKRAALAELNENRA